MHLLQINDLQDGHIQVQWQREGGVARTYPQPLPFADPLSPADRAELRWYLEDYLQFPYGAEVYRAQQVEQHMADWGRRLFEQAFPRLPGGLGGPGHTHARHGRVCPTRAAQPFPVEGSFSARACGECSR